MKDYLPKKLLYYKNFADAMQKKFMQVRFGVKGCTFEQDIQTALMRKELVDWQQNNDGGALTQVSINYYTNLGVEYDLNTSDLLGDTFSYNHGGIGGVTGPGCAYPSLPPQSFKINYDNQIVDSNIIEVNTAGCITRINLNPNIEIETGPSTFVFHQSTASTLWTIIHNLGFVPNVFTISNTGSNIRGVITPVNLNTITIGFSSPIAGTAYLS